MKRFARLRRPNRPFSIFAKALMKPVPSSANGIGAPLNGAGKFPIARAVSGSWLAYERIAPQSLYRGLESDRNGDSAPEGGTLRLGPLVYFRIRADDRHIARNHSRFWRLSA